ARQHRRLVPRSRADLEHAMRGLRVEQLAHECDHVWLRNRLTFADGKRKVFVGFVCGYVGDEEVALDGAHRIQHARVVDPARLDLCASHFDALFGHGRGVMVRRRPLRYLRWDSARRLLSDGPPLSTVNASFTSSSDMRICANWSASRRSARYGTSL